MGINAISGASAMRTPETHSSPVLNTSQGSSLPSKDLVMDALKKALDSATEALSSGSSMAGGNVSHLC